MRIKSLVYAVLLLALVLGNSSVTSKSLESGNKTTTYMVTLEQPPLALYKGNIGNYKATNISVTGQRKLNAKSSQSKAYMSYLKTQQDDLLSVASKALKTTLKPQRRYSAALNGFTLELTAKQAQSLQQIQGVKSVQPTLTYKPHTDRGPTMIKAPDVWGGIFNSTQARGEGIVVGIIDTGIRHDHPSFAEVSPSDGYTHINPLGNGVYLGDCVAQPSLCNSKLIGSYNFVTDNTDPSDENSHGTHVAGTAIGNTLDFDLGGGNSMELSGVAPRANVISYKIADVEGTTVGGASTSAIEQAILDGVDVINYSFGSDSVGSPWNDASAMAYLSAREAGIVVMTSAGNSGPLAETVGAPANAPWLTSVAATTHDRGAFPDKGLTSMTGGTTTPPADIVGQSLTGSITASIVYAGDYDNGDTNPEQCLTPFPANTFTGQIVLCDRGEIARVEKARNVADGGAGGYILANVSGGATNLADDIYVIPGIHINAADGTSVRDWLTGGGSDHMATITGTNGAVGLDPSAGDIVAGFSSRGPNANPASVLAPSLAAPGVSILAADILPVDYGFKNGTSMASPHAAGAAALLVQLQPNWSPAQIHSALATSGSIALAKEDGVTSADSFDIGGGRIDIPSALNAGLTISETGANFRNANPALTSPALEPKELNLPSMADNNCLSNCSWSRTVTAVGGTTWNVNITQPANGTISVSESSFTLAADESISLDIDIDTGNAAQNEWLMGAVTLVPTGGGFTSTRLPVVAKNINSSFNGHIELESNEASGSHQFTNVSSIAEANATTTVYASQATVETLNLAADSDNSEVYDDLTDGVAFRTISVAAGSQLLVVKTDNSTANDMDLYVGFDENGNGQPDEFEELKSSTSPDANEDIVIDFPVAGTYWIMVQNWQGGTGATDAVDLSYGVVGSTVSSNITLSAPSSLDGTTNFNIDMAWSGLTQSGGKWFGVAALGNASDPDFLGSHSFIISRPAVANAPTADFSFSATDLTVSFTDASSGGQGTLTYAWNFGDSTTSTSQSPNHTYSAAGTYSVELTVTDSQSGTDSMTRSVTVSAPAEPPSSSGGGGGIPLLLIFGLIALSLKRR